LGVSSSSLFFTEFHARDNNFFTALILSISSIPTLTAAAAFKTAFFAQVYLLCNALPFLCPHLIFILKIKLDFYFNKFAHQLTYTHTAV
jgi:hypothetical protein